MNSIFDKKIDFYKSITKQKREYRKINNFYLYARCVNY